MLDAALLGQSDAKTGLLLALVAREHAYLEGPPGCGKSALAEAFARASTGRHAAIRFHRDTRESDLLGDAVLHRSQVGGGERLRRAVVPGPLLRAEVAVLDDVTRAPGEALGPLLRILSERRALGSGLPLETAVATASPPELDAHADPVEPNQLDRFAVQVRMRGVLYDGDWRAARSALDRDVDETREGPVLSASERHGLQEAAAGLPLASGLIDALFALIRRLVAASQGAAQLSDRSFGRAALRLARAHALLRGAECVEGRDLRALRFLLGRRVPEDVQASFDALLQEVLVDFQAPGQVSLSARGGTRAGDAGAGASPPTVPVADERRDQALTDKASAERVRPAEVEPLLAALAGHIERGRAEFRENPGGAPRSYRRLRTLDEIYDADPAEATLFSEGRLPGAPSVYRRQRRDAGGALALLRDISASMEGRLSRWTGQVTAGVVRLGARQRMRVGYVEFNHEARRFASRGMFFHRRYPELLGLAAQRRAEGRTNYEAPLGIALDEFERRPGRNRHAVLLTDGVPVLGDPMVRAERARARRLGVRIHTVFLGLGSCPAVLDEISAESGGLRFVGTPSADGGLSLRPRRDASE